MGKKDNVKKEKSSNLEDDRMREKRQFNLEDKKKDSKEFEHFESEIFNNEVGEDATQYGEFVSSYFAWIPLPKQKERADELDKITKKDKK